MRIDPAGWPFVWGFLAIAIVVGLTWAPMPAILPLALAGVMLFFFRDPDRVGPADPLTVLAPADGRVIAAGPSTTKTLSADKWQQISIFLSPLDVHVNRMPVSGRVSRVEYYSGRFLPAYRVGAGNVNECNEVWLDADGTTVVVRQMVGLLARRIVCRIREGASVKAGQRFGVMKFGSRMDVFLPWTATISARRGDRVFGGLTCIARLASRQLDKAWSPTEHSS
jgi:phosphatidylserine decarboxylase